jgi:excisionase family DNA binding protein
MGTIEPKTTLGGPRLPKRRPEPEVSLDDSEIMHADEQPDRGAGNPTQLAEKGRKVSGRGAIPSSLSPDAESEVMTVRGVAQYLHCHYSTIYRLVEHRQLPGFRLGGNWRFLRSDIEKWIAAGGGKPSGSAPAKSGGGRPGRKPKASTTKS